MPLKKGKPAPPVQLPDQSGKLVDLEKFRGKKIVLYFYPQDNTPTCTEEACNLRDNYKALMKAGYMVFGISPDSVKKHANFIAKFNLPFSLLADPELKAIKAFKVWAMKKTFGHEHMGVLRTTYIIDENGIIEEVIEKVVSKDHASQIMGK
ncbi:MAG: thioredoxin-dependent thiol peroxidase [Bacteroidetes bacterium]|nr:thioredoxin-dependent thiol peroxidase [Bacteroidota bacterium]